MAIYYVYIICNLEGVYYKGFSFNPTKRLEEHNLGKSRYTSNRGPWHLVFVTSFVKKSEALKYEKMLKRQNHVYLEWLIKSNRNEL
ncbi:MAG: GIY-YIG nuclease family protein [Saprospiraceae bacterium]|nr:GIY-YIG nuclease family protein [Saprospiraceae bacterium]